MLQNYVKIFNKLFKCIYIFLEQKDRKLTQININLFYNWLFSILYILFRINSNSNYYYIKIKNC